VKKPIELKVKVSFSKPLPQKKTDGIKNTAVASCLSMLGNSLKNTLNNFHTPTKEMAPDNKLATIILLNENNTINDDSLDTKKA